MNKLMTLTSMFSAVLFFVSFVAAAPAASLKERDVVDPPVTAPNATSVWVVGSTQTVVWDISNLPSSISNSTGTVLLGFVNDTSGNEHLMINNPLASGFDITIGHVDIVVPDVESRDDYVVALLGDSGNISPKFTITASSSSSSVSSSSALTGSSSPASSTPSISPSDPSDTATLSTVDQTFTTEAVSSTGLSGTIAPTGTANSLSATDPSTSASPSSTLTTATVSISASSTPVAASTSPSSTTTSNGAVSHVITSGSASIIVPFLALFLAI